MNLSALEHPIWHQVMGFMDRDVKNESPLLPKSEPSSNHEHAMRRFHECGYEVRFLVVSPHKVGIPAMRARIHYQGLLRSKFPGLNVPSAMDGLLDEWKGLDELCNFGHTFSDYIQGPDDIQTEAEPEPHQPPNKRQRTFKWEAMHENFQMEHNVP